jgi:hypothetical protein
VDFADFLSGLPYQTFYDVVEEDNDGKSTHYHFFAQDQWKVSSNLSLSYGIRYELHPGYYDVHGDIGNFVPIPGSGESIYPDGAASLLATDLFGQRQCLHSLWFDHRQHDQRCSLHAGAFEQPGRLPEGLEKISSSTGSCRGSASRIGPSTTTRRRSAAALACTTTRCWAPSSIL